MQIPRYFDRLFAKNPGGSLYLPVYGIDGTPADGDVPVSRHHHHRIDGEGGKQKRQAGADRLSAACRPAALHR